LKQNAGHCDIAIELVALHWRHIACQQAITKLSTAVQPICTQLQRPLPAPLLPLPKPLQQRFASTTLHRYDMEPYICRCVRPLRHFIRTYLAVETPDIACAVRCTGLQMQRAAQLACTPVKQKVLAKAQNQTGSTRSSAAKCSSHLRPAPG